MQFTTLAVLSFLSITTITAHPLTTERRNLDARDTDAQADRTSSPPGLAAREAFPFNMDDITQGAHHTMDHVRHTTHNQTVAVTEQAHKYAPSVKKYEPEVEMGACAIGAFIPVVDIAIDSACLALVAAKGGHAVYKHAHNHTATATHTAKHTEPSHTSDPLHHSNSPVHLDAAQHPDPPQHPDPSPNPEPPQHSGASQQKRDRYIRNMRAYWDFV